MRQNQEKIVYVGSDSLFRQTVTIPSMTGTQIEGALRLSGIASRYNFTVERRYDNGPMVRPGFNTEVSSGFHVLCESDSAGYFRPDTKYEQVVVSSVVAADDYNRNPGRCDEIISNLEKVATELQFYFATLAEKSPA